MSECCNGKNTILYACSGASDVGEITDKVARKLREEGSGKMSCLAGIGANVSGYVETARGANECIVIDGCPVNCGKKMFENQKLKGKFFTLTELGLEKGKTPVAEKIVNEMVEKIKKNI